MEEHKGSRETFDYIADWGHPKFFYSLNDHWGRMGMLGILGDYILCATAGDILEIGIGESSIYLTALSKKFKRKIYHCDLSASKIINPLTIPGYLSEDNDYITEYDDKVPSARCLLYAGPSDKFFKRFAFTPIALAFIDGDHNYEQAKKDFYNILPLVADNGYIFLHDSYPPSVDYLSEHRCGTVYILRQELEANRVLFDCFTFPKGTAMDVGITMIRKKPIARAYYNE